MPTGNGISLTRRPPRWWAKCSSKPCRKPDRRNRTARRRGDQNEGEEHGNQENPAHRHAVLPNDIPGNWDNRASEGRERLKREAVVASSSSVCNAFTDVGKSVLPGAVCPWAWFSLAFAAIIGWIIPDPEIRRKFCEQTVQSSK